MEALRALDSSVPLDLLVTDIVMPPSMPHGIAVAHMAKNKRPGIGIIYMTGHPDKMPEGEIDADATPLLLKPLRFDTLLDAVADVLGRGASAPS
jgi:DNA-binding NtrC family response regulator